MWISTRWSQMMTLSRQKKATKFVAKSVGHFTMQLCLKFLPKSLHKVALRNATSLNSQKKRSFDVLQAVLAKESLLQRPGVTCS